MVNMVCGLSVKLIVVNLYFCKFWLQIALANINFHNFNLEINSVVFKKSFINSSFCLLCILKTLFLFLVVSEISSQLIIPLRLVQVIAVLINYAILILSFLIWKPIWILVPLSLRISTDIICNSHRSSFSSFWRKPESIIIERDFWICWIILVPLLFRTMLLVHERAYARLVSIFWFSKFSLLFLWSCGTLNIMRLFFLIFFLIWSFLNSFLLDRFFNTLQSLIIYFFYSIIHLTDTLGLHILILINLNFFLLFWFFALFSFNFFAEICFRWNPSTWSIWKYLSLNFSYTFPRVWSFLQLLVCLFLNALVCSST